LSGASGGTIGNCAFYSLLKSRAYDSLNNFSLHSDSFFSSDFMTFTLSRLLGPDFFRHIIPLNTVIDRAAALETSMEKGRDSLICSYFSQPLGKVFDTTGRLPIFFINSTRVKDGMPGEICSVQLPDFSLRKNILKMVEDSNGTTKGSDTGSDIHFSTAGVLSSRFPFLSPAGNIQDNYFVDGGYFDNSGAGIVLEFMQQLKKDLSDTTDIMIKKYGRKLRFNLVQLYLGSDIDTVNKPMHPLINDLLTPVLTLAGMQGSSTTVGNGILINFFKGFNTALPGRRIEFSLYDTLKKDPEGYPMSWVISDYNLLRMKKRMDFLVLNNYAKFHFGN
jgi:hypothetical protein